MTSVQPLALKSEAPKSTGLGLSQIPESNAEVGVADAEDRPNTNFAQPLPQAEVENARTVSERIRQVDSIPADKKQEYVKRDPKKTIRELTDRLFVRESTFPTRDRRLRSYTPINFTKIEQSMLVGEFFNYEDTGFWRILGMRPRRTAGPCIEYDVVRLSQRKGKTKKPSKTEGAEFVMKMCDSDSPNCHLLFLQQLAFLHEFREAFVAHPQRHRFPEFMGSGAFDQLCYKDNSNDEEAAKVFMLLPRPHPRPYFLIERVGPTIEDLMRANQFGILDISTARFITIGCIQTLRLMHEMGWVHRCVSNYTFALRVGLHGFMSDFDLCFNVVCVDAGFVRRFRTQPPRRVAPFAGTYKYASINAMENREQMPNDDLISALYLFVEMIHGQLPWHGVSELKKIVEMKKKLQTEPPILIDNTGHCNFPIDLRRLPQAFKLIENFNPFRRDDYLVYRDLYTILNVIAETNRHTITEDYVVVEKFKNVTKKLHTLVNQLRDRGAEPEVVKPAGPPKTMLDTAPPLQPATSMVFDGKTMPNTQPPVPMSSTKERNEQTPTDTRSTRSKKKQKPKVVQLVPTTTTTNESRKEKQRKLAAKTAQATASDLPPSIKEVTGQDEDFVAPAKP